MTIQYRAEQTLYACILAAVGLWSAFRIVVQTVDRGIDRAFGGELS